MSAFALFWLLATPAPSADPPALYPAAQCAAFWLGRDDYATRSAYLDNDPSDPARAAAFRAAAVRLNGGDAAPVEAFIAKERHNMDLLFEAFIYGGDKQSRDVHDILLETCARFGREAAETKGLN